VIHVYNASDIHFMKSASTALGNFLLSVQGLSPTNAEIAPVASFWYADLFTVTRLDGIVARWTSWGLPLKVGLLMPTNITVSAAVWGSGTGVFTVNSTAALTTGQVVSLVNSNPGGWNFTSQTIFVADAVTFSISMPNPGVPYIGGGSVALIGTPQTFSAFGPYIRRSSVAWATGLDNKSMKIILGADATMQIGPSGRVIPVIQALAQDLFASATVRVDRLIMPMPGDTSLCTYNLWLGIIGDVAVKRASAEITVDSQLIQLNVQVPRAVYSPGCRHVFGDSSCTFNLATVTSSGTVVSGGNRFVIASNLAPPVAPLPPASAPSLTFSHNSLINIAARTVWVTVTYTGTTVETVAGPESSIAMGPSDLVVVASPAAEANATGYNVYIGGAPGDETLQNATPIAIGTSYTEASVGFTQGVSAPIAGFGGYYAEGVIAFTSGVLSGLARQVQASDGSGNITCSSGFPQAPAIGDTFTVRRGCSKTLSACTGYSNILNFGGMPFTPQPESSGA
jgi:hypothetical protein